MSKNGLFAWADLAAPDTAKAAAFYKQVLGWDHQEIPNAGGYGFFTHDGKMAAGMGPLPPEQQQAGQPPVWSAYVFVDDADDVFAKAKANGATPVVEPMDVMEAGRMAFFADPTGAMVGLWQPKEHKGADAFNDPGFMTWNELHTRDISKAKAFYEAILPWKLETQDVGGMEYTVIQLDDDLNGGMMAMPPGMPAEVPSYWATYFRVADCDEAVEQVTANGGAVRQGPQDSPYGRMAVVSDPFGAAFAIIGVGQS